MYKLHSLLDTLYFCHLPVIVAQPISMLIHDVMWVWFYDTTFYKSITYQDPGVGDNYTCILLPDPFSCERVWLLKLPVTLAGS